jgi:hypothetical protein
MVLSVLSALALSVGMLAATNDLINEGSSVEKSTVQVEQIRIDASSSAVESDR